MALKRISQEWKVLYISGAFVLKSSIVTSVGKVELLIPATNARKAE
jgi:hypothetical protein